MAEETYPTMPARQWWKLRDIFKRSLPSSVSSNYLATVLSISEESVSANILPCLRTIGLIDPQNKTNDLAVKWRDDNLYKEVCESIIKAAYPDELKEIGNSSADRNAIEGWFSRQLRVGESAAKKMTAFYLLLKDGSLNSADITRKTEKKTAENTVKEHNQRIKKKDNNFSKEKEHFKYDKNLHLNIQIHISPDASLDQIDQIFACMAKHLPM